MNPKLQKVTKDIERAKAKIADLKAALPAMEELKTRLENEELIKAFRAANVAPENIDAFIEACKTTMGSPAPVGIQPAPLPNTLRVEDFENEEA